MRLRMFAEEVEVKNRLATDGLPEEGRDADGKVAE